GTRADAERQRDDGDRGEGAGAAQHPQPVADILRERLEPGPWRHVVNLLFDQRAVAERAPGRVFRVAGAHAALAQFLGLELQIGRELAIDIVIVAWRSRHLSSVPLT